jgi:hypothetical protein
VPLSYTAEKQIVVGNRLIEPGDVVKEVITGEDQILYHAGPKGRYFVLHDFKLDEKHELKAGQMIEIHPYSQNKKPKRKQREQRIITPTTRKEIY